MEITIENKNHVAIIKLKGRLDSNTSSELDQKVLSVIQNGTPDVLLDFSGVEYLSSAGIRILVHCYKEIEKKGGQIVLANVTKPIEQVLYLTGFLPYFKIYENSEEALNALKKETS